VCNLTSWDGMSRACSICVHPERDQIEEAIVARIPYRRIAKTHGVSISAISRHLKAHMAEELLAMLRERAEALREREMTAFLGPELVEWMRADEAELAELLNQLEEGVEEVEHHGVEQPPRELSSCPQRR
jgi:DNA-binding transcriptional ArsR family regulator